MMKLSTLACHMPCHMTLPSLRREFLTLRLFGQLVFFSLRHTAVVSLCLEKADAILIITIATEVRVQGCLTPSTQRTGK